MTPESLKQLEALARAATPGPYFPETYSGGQRQVCGDLRPLDEDEDAYTVVADVFTRENHEYQVAANPAAILALIAEVRRLKAERDGLLTACRKAILPLAHAAQREPVYQREYEALSAAIDAARAAEKP
jgi:hypothetical protein